MKMKNTATQTPQFSLHQSHGKCLSSDDLSLSELAEMLKSANIVVHSKVEDGTKLKIVFSKSKASR